MILALTLPNWLSLTATTLGVVAFVASGYVVLKTNLAQKTAELWKAEAEVLNRRLTTVEEGEKLCKERLAGVEAANQVLADQVTGASAVIALQQAVTTQYADVTKRLDDIGRALDRRSS